METYRDLLDDVKHLRESLKADEERLCLPLSSTPDALIWLHNEGRLHAIHDLRDLDKQLSAIACTPSTPTSISAQDIRKPNSRQPSDECLHSLL